MYYTSSKSRSLVDHIDSGKSWDLDRRINGLFLFNFTSDKSKLGDIDVLSDNMEFIYRAKQDYVIMSSSYMVCNMDYNEPAKYHEQSGSDVTFFIQKNK